MKYSKGYYVEIAPKGTDENTIYSPMFKTKRGVINFYKKLDFQDKSFYSIAILYSNMNKGIFKEVEGLN